MARISELLQFGGTDGEPVSVRVSVLGLPPFGDWWNYCGDLACIIADGVLLSHVRTT
jgi:hypothetical protein